MTKDCPYIDDCALYPKVWCLTGKYSRCEAWVERGSWYEKLDHDPETEDMLLEALKHGP